MSYCVALRLDSGLVFMADTLTNAGVDNISHYSKIHHWSRPGELQLFLLTAGNLATSQAVVSHLNEASKLSGKNESIVGVTSMFQAAKLVGQQLREVIVDMSKGGQEASNKFDSTLILGGQIKGENMSLYADITKIRNELNWLPKTSIDEGLNKTVNWYLEKWSNL